eukprot:TRINITY_DN2559_c0_g1_i1.p1 TRINITY_DN2559_c0_g1~~TRINITY_DN2559_c0_g1_i1.p1  ORF type:complete len:332 (+),score=57.85 TRINITY_DN2559_c0_g1_i1:100-996(+)
MADIRCNSTPFVDRHVTLITSPIISLSTTNSASSPTLPMVISPRQLSEHKSNGFLTAEEKEKFNNLSSTSLPTTLNGPQLKKPGTKAKKYASVNEEVVVRNPLYNPNTDRRSTMKRRVTLGVIENLPKEREKREKEKSKEKDKEKDKDLSSMALSPRGKLSTLGAFLNSLQSDGSKKEPYPISSSSASSFFSFAPSSSSSNSSSSSSSSTEGLIHVSETSAQGATTTSSSNALRRRAVSKEEIIPKMTKKQGFFLSLAFSSFVHFFIFYQSAQRSCSHHATIWWPCQAVLPSMRALCT